MKLAERGEDGLRPQAERRRASRVPRRPGIGGELQIGNRCPRRLEQGEHFGLGVIGIEAVRLTRLPIARGAFAGEEDRRRRPFALGEVATADFEQANRARPAVSIAPRRRHQPGEQRRAHRLHFFADRVGEAPRRATEALGIGGRDEAPVDRLVEASRRRGAPHTSLKRLRAGRGGFRHAFRTGQRGRGDVIISDDPRDFLDQVGGPVDIAPPARHDRVVTVEGETQ